MSELLNMTSKHNQLHLMDIYLVYQPRSLAKICSVSENLVESGVHIFGVLKYLVLMLFSALP